MNEFNDFFKKNEMCGEKFILDEKQDLNDRKKEIFRLQTNRKLMVSLLSNENLSYSLATYVLGNLSLQNFVLTKEEVQKVYQVRKDNLIFCSLLLLFSKNSFTESEKIEFCEKNCVDSGLTKKFCE
ncbi:MAG: hypothetical protein WCR30_04205 [Clostridia bacterium]